MMALREQSIKNSNIDAQSNQKLPLSEKISYGFGDMASNLIYTVITTYLTFYFTDVYGIGAAAVGTMMLIVRFVDMIDSPIFGILIDKTKTRWGKSRPWILWTCIPFTVGAIALFAGPDLSEGGKLTYAYILYILVSVLYAAINGPLATMLPSMTSNVQERTVANTFRMVGGQLGGLIVNMSLIGLVAYLGAGDQQKGFFYTMTLFSVLAFVLFLITFFGTKERVHSASGKVESIPLKESVKAIKGNRPWIIMSLLVLVFFMMYITKLSASIYYITYYVGKPGVVSLINSLGMVTIVGILSIPFLTKKFSKKSVIMAGLIISIMGQLVIYLGDQNITIIAIGTVIGGIGLGLPAGLLFVLMADTVDYGEWKSGIRAQGLLVSASSVGFKLGSGLGAAIPAWLLAFGGYAAGKAQTQTSLNMISFSYIWIPVILGVIAFILMIFYKWEKPHEEIITELEARRTAQN
ncbi:glycoside-pentoside-hexuronide (GPH):cation symporter [Alkalihalobacillus sp. 1P02AB]|uniref:glycoside-pentoside-hexuronide (GPH):cation symporter n=1 Tax=Alkalihalobacillus sp. 1P02AB TaxID=3132260 RepID=UPI0039A59929